MPVLREPAITRWERPDASGHAIVLPGFLDGRDDPGIVALCETLHRGGLTVVAGDPPGVGDSSADLADLGPTTRLVNIAAHVRSAPRMVLVGQCYGGLLACLAAARDPRVTDVVALMPSRCFIWPEDHDPELDTWRRQGVHRFDREDRSFDVPYSVVEDALRHDLPAALAGLRQRILFVAGERDELIGVEPVRRLHKECGSSDKTLAVLPVQHDFREFDHEITAVAGAVVAWLDASR